MRLHPYPGLFGDERSRGLAVPLIASVVLHVVLFAAFARFHIRHVDRAFFSPIHMVDLVEPGRKPRGASEAPAKAEAPPPQAPTKEARPPAEVVKKATEPAKAPTPKPQPKPQAKPPPSEARSVPVEPTEPVPSREPSPEFTEQKIADKIARMREKLGQPEPAVEPAPAPQDGGRVRDAVESIRSRLAPAQTTETAGSGEGNGAVGVRGGTNVLQQVRLRAYYNRLWEHVNAHWTIPPSLQGRDYTVIVSVVIDREGRVLKSWVEESSGSEPFDQSALRALQRAEPLPAVPNEVTDATLEVGFRFHGE